MNRTTKELLAELEDIREGLLIALESKGSLEIIDLKFMAQRVDDIKQELRIARARGD